ncbi:MAG: SGNH/GDSL hydrolase family protein [Micropruina sp.]
MGDSFSAGTGAITQLGDYLDLSDGCLRSTHAYPRQIAAAQGWNLRHRACQGATTADVAGQLGALDSSTDVVTITIGGNDIGFIPVILACSTPGTTKDCLKAVVASQTAMVLRLPSALKKVYSAIKRAAPNARIVAVGYPRLFSGTDCSPETDYARRAAGHEHRHRCAERQHRRDRRQVGHRVRQPDQDVQGPRLVRPERLDQRARLHGAAAVQRRFDAPNVAGQTGYATVVAKSLKN